MNGESRESIIANLDTRTKVFGLIALIAEASFLASIPALPPEQIIFSLCICAAILLVMLIGMVWLEKDKHEHKPIELKKINPPHVDDALRNAHEHALSQVKLENNKLLRCPVNTLLYHLDSLYKACDAHDIIKGFDLDPLRWHYDSMTHRNYFGVSNTAALRSGASIRRIFAVNKHFILDEEIYHVLQLVLYEQLKEGVDCRIIKYEELGPNERKEDVVLMKDYAAIEQFDDLGSTTHMAQISNDTDLVSNLNDRFEKLWKSPAREVNVETMPSVLHQLRLEYEQ